jgi:hypothetical protein
MANTLTNLIPDAYAALDVVSRELVGFIPSVARDPKADQVAVNETLRIHAAPANSAGGDITAAMSLPSAADQTFTNKTLTISKSRFFPFSWSGEEEKAVDKGPGYLTLQQDQIAQAIRAAINEMESDIWTAAYKGASRAYGTAATTPFASTLADPANIKKILDDNGAPSMDRSLVIDTTAGAAMRTLAQLTKANEANDATLLRQGTLLDLHGFAVRESSKVAAVTAGAMASATTTNAALTVGQTVLPLATAGTGVVAAGDMFTLANDTNIYVVTSVSFAGANPASGDSITIAAPGLKKAQAAATRAITVIATSTRNVGFSRNGILLATRLPAMPSAGDLATDRQVITDDRTGISFELAVYPGFRMNVYHVSVAWGVSVIKPEHVAVLLG